MAVLNSYGTLPLGALGVPLFETGWRPPRKERKRAKKSKAKDRP